MLVMSQKCDAFRSDHDPFQVLLAKVEGLVEGLGCRKEDLAGHLIGAD